MMHIYSPKLCKMCLNIFFTLHTKNQEQRGAGEAAEAAQAEDPVGGGALPAGGRQDRAGEGVQVSTSTS